MQKITQQEAFDAARFTLRALLTVMMNNAEVFDEEAPATANEHGLQSWATRLRQRINDTEVSWHIVSDEDGLIDISRSVVFETPAGQPISHTTLLRQVDVAEVGKYSLSSIICQLIIGTGEVPMMSRKEHKEWVRVAGEDAAYIFHMGVDYLIGHPSTEVANRWNETVSDDRAELFEIIHEAAEKGAGRPLGGHKALWMLAGVVFASNDVYQDAFAERANQLVGSVVGQ